MNGIIANLQDQNPKIHRLNAEGMPLCGVPKIMETIRHELVCPTCNNVMLLKEERKQHSPIIQNDMGEVTCKDCLKRLQQGAQS